MDNLLRKGINEVYYFSYNLCYYFSMGYYAFKKIYISFLNEFLDYNKLCNNFITV